MKHQTRIFLSTLLALLLTLPSLAQAKDSPAQSAARQAIQTAYNRQGQALQQKDVATYMSFIAPDYMSYGTNGTVVDRQKIENVYSLMLTKGLFPGIITQYTKANTKILSLTWRGPDAIVIAQTTVVVNTSNGSRHVITEGVGTTRDYWSPLQGGWKIRQSVERITKMWADGKRLK